MARRGLLPARDLVGGMLDDLPEALQRTRWIQLATALARPFQVLYDATLAVQASRNLNIAVADQLDQIGSLVGQPRDTSDDEVYRQRIRAKISVNRSIGVIDDIARISRLVLNSDEPTIEVGGGGATATLSTFGAAISDMLAADLAGFGRRAVSSGIRFLSLTTTATDEESFVLGWIPDVADGSFAIGDSSISTVNADGQFTTWPSSGRISIDGAVYAYVKSTGASLNISPPLIAELSGGEVVEPYVVGKGLGAEAESGQPALVPYTSPGTTGGQMADVR